MDTIKLSKVTVLERFDLNGKTYSPGTAQVPVDKVEGLRKKKLILDEHSDEDEPMSGTTLEAELLAVLAPHIAEHGEDESAVECLTRIVDERDNARDQAQIYLRESESKGNLLGVANNRADVAEQTSRELQSELEILRAQVSGGQITGNVGSTIATATGENAKTEEKTPVDAKELTALVGAKGALVLMNAGFDTREKINAATDKELDDLEGIADKSIEKLRAEFEVKTNG